MRAPGRFDGLARLFRGRRERVALDYLLEHADPSAPLPERVAWLTELTRWIRVHRPPNAGDDAKTRCPTACCACRCARIRFLLQLLDRNPEWKTRVAQTLRSVLRDSHGLRLFATTGLPQEFGFWSEAVRRIAAKLLPEPPAHDDLAQVFLLLFPERSDERLPLALPPGTLRRRCGALFRHEEPPEEACWAVVRRDLDDAVVVLAAQVAAIGLSDAIRRRAGPVRPRPLAVRRPGRGGAGLPRRGAGAT